MNIHTGALSQNTRNPIDGRLHFSELKAIGESPQHYLLACAEVRKPWSEAVRIGLIADALIFGLREVRVYRGVASNEDGRALEQADVEAVARGEKRVARKTPRQGKAWEAFEAQAIDAGAITCIQSEYDKAIGAAEAVLYPRTRGAEKAAQLLEACTDKQIVMHWDLDGFPCASGIGQGEFKRGGIEGFGNSNPLNPSRRLLLDVKVTSDVEPEALMRHASRMRWHAQLAWNESCLESWLGWAPETIDKYLICIEADAPHVVTVLEFAPDEAGNHPAIEAGHKSIKLWTGKLRACEVSGNWGGYCDSPVDFELPEWAE